MLCFWSGTELSLRPGCRYVIMIVGQHGAVCPLRPTHAAQGMAMVWN